jgi:hypothetical protein
MTFDLLEQERGAVGAVRLVQELTNLVARIDFFGHAEQLAVPVQQAEEVAEIDARHDTYCA